MSHLKKTLAIFLMVCMLAGMMPVGTAFAAEDGVTAAETTTGDNTTGEKSATTTETPDAGTTPGDTTPCAHGNKETLPAVAATCTAPGMTEGVKCADCGEIITAQAEIPALGHTWENGTCKTCGAKCEHIDEEVEPVPAKAASCTEAGNNAGEKYKSCGAIRSGCEVIPATGHDWSKKDGVCANGCGATCDHTKPAENGGTVTAFQNSVCSACGFTCTHPAASVENVEELKADCTTAGHTAGKKCKVCGVFTEGGAEIPALGHTWTDTADGKKQCSVCKEFCQHDWSKKDGICTQCGYHCAHETFNHYASYSRCATCKLKCSHENLTGNVCDLCKQSIEATVTRNNSVTKYAALEDITFILSGSTVKLLTDVAVEAPDKVFKVTAANTVLDLNGKKLTGTNGLAIMLSKGSLTIRNGTVEAAAEKGSGAIWVSGGAKLTIEKSATVDGKMDHGVVLIEKGTTAEIYGTLKSDKQAAISGIGNPGQEGTIINVYDGAVLTSTNGTAIYHPQNGTLNIKGGTITGGATGVEVRAGTANISGGLIEGKGDPFSADPNGSGSTAVGAGLAVVQHTTACPITVNISGGTLKGVRAIFEANVQGNSQADIDKVAINVTGGELKGQVYSSDDKITFSGAAKDRPMTVPTADDAANPNAVVADPNYVHAGAKNEISTGAKTDAVITKKALKECASSNDTIVTVDTPAASVSFDAAALQTINAAVPEDTAGVTNYVTVHVEKVAGAPEDIYMVYVTDQNGNKIGSGEAGLGGKATVVLKGVAAAPKQVRHLTDDGAFIERLEPSQPYDGNAKTLTVTLTRFSQIVLSAHEMPAIDENSLTLPTALIGKAYGPEQLDAAGDKPITWSVTTGALPDGLELSEDGKLRGTVAEDAEEKDYTVTVKAENAYGFDTAELTITVQKNVVAVIYETDALGNPIIVEDPPTYSSVQDAVDDATEDQVIFVVQDSNENVVVEGKYVNICGDAQGRRLGSITVKTDDQGNVGVAGIGLIKADKVTVEKGAYAALVIGNDIKSVVNKNTVSNLDNADPNVVIDGGHYGSLSPAESGSYQVLDGEFDKAIPMEYCREVDENGNFVKQRCAKLNQQTNKYDIVDFKFDITAVSNSGYHMPGSQKTLVFSTNLDYKLAIRDRAEGKITITSSNSSKPISSVYYDITEGKDGKAQIVLKASTLNRLAIGRYSLKYDGPTGADSMYFHISKTVKTGDTSNIGLWMGIMGVSVVVLCAVAAVLVMKSKKKNGGAKRKDEKK